MIKVNGCVITPTHFPDGTSQVWNLPEWLLRESPGSDQVVWYFEQEREIIDLLSVCELLVNPFAIFMPYLPYARQDKEVSNKSTFNLRVLGRILYSTRAFRISSVDVHNPDLSRRILPNFINITVDHIHRELVNRINPQVMVYPDAGAQKRYSATHGLEYIVFEKHRDQQTGNILGHKICVNTCKTFGRALKYLIVDDLCDGGQTFINIAKELKDQDPDADMHLFVTHGIFSKGRKILEDAGIKLYTTNSLLKNEDGYKV